VLALTRHGRETAVEDKNAWTCMVDRGWSGMLDHPDFWNPKIRAAACSTDQRSVHSFRMTSSAPSWSWQATPRKRSSTATHTAIAKKEMPMLQPGAICFMMSRKSYLFDQGDHTMSHVMFYTPDDGTPWGPTCSTLSLWVSTTGSLHRTPTRSSGAFQESSFPHRGR
jgi:hypothetical protein